MLRLRIHHRTFKRGPTRLGVDRCTRDALGRGVFWPWLSAVCTWNRGGGQNLNFSVAAEHVAALLQSAAEKPKALTELPEPRTGSGREVPESEDSEEKPAGLEKATFGAGCFWCTEAVFQQLKGVKSVVSGYSGGQVKDPTYEQVLTGTTGHAEVVQVSYDPKLISYEELLEVFWKTHDPTTLNEQGPDVGTPYRSAVFYHTQDQKEQAETYKRKLEKAREFKRPIVTEITRFKAFYPAQAYHQNYFNHNSRKSYCARVIRPKVNKVKKVFKDKLK